MKILIQRRGSGWGGYYGCMLLDIEKGMVYQSGKAAHDKPKNALKKLENTKANEINLNEKFLEIMQYTAQLRHTTFGMPLEEINETSVENILKSIEELKTAKIVDDGSCWMDQQIDVVHIFFEGDKSKLVYSSECSEIAPDDKELKQVVERVVNIVWGLRT